MPRSERRRWWLEPNKREKWVLRNSVTGMRQRICIEDYAGDRAVVALWRLAQVLRIRLNRALVECDIRAGMKRDDEAAWSRILLDADSALLEARCSEEAMRVERDKYRAIANKWTAAVKAVKAPEPMPMIELDEDCNYPDCGHGPACAGCDEYHPEHDDK